MLEARLKQQVSSTPAATATNKTTGQASSNLSSVSNTTATVINQNTQKALDNINALLGQKSTSVSTVTRSVAEAQATAQKIAEDYLKNGELRFGIGTDAITQYVDNTKKKVDDPANAIDEMFGDHAAQVNYYYNISGIDLNSDIDTKTTKSKAEMSDINITIDKAITSLFSSIGTGIAGLASRLYDGLSEIGTDLKTAVNSTGDKLRKGLDDLSTIISSPFGMFGEILSIGFVDFLTLFTKTTEISEEDMQAQMETMFRISKKVADKMQVDELRRVLG